MIKTGPGYSRPFFFCAMLPAKPLPERAAGAMHHEGRSVGDGLKQTAFSLVTLALLAAPALAADPLVGTWQTQPGRGGGFGHVEITPCSGGLCGTVVRTFDQTGKAVAANDLGALILDKVVATGGGAYGEGRIINPETGRGYTARLNLRGDQLDIGGCVMMICRNAGTWQRVN